MSLRMTSEASEKSGTTMEDILLNFIGKDVVVSYCYTGGESDNASGYDEGILKEVGNGYIILDISKVSYYYHNLTVINLANVTNVYLNKR